MLVGREGERDAIERLLERARRGEAGSLVLRGEPGVGKTVLLEHAVGLAATGMSTVRATGIESDARLEFSGLLEVCRREEAIEQLAAWVELGAETAGRWALPAVERCRGLVATDDAFREPFARSLELHEVLRDPYAEARTRLVLGERLRRAGERVEGRRELNLALEIFERLDADAWAERARRELRASGMKLRRRADVGDELTPQELQVATQVAEGKSNKEVAAARFLSAKTVEFHLGRTYRKLGIGSRAELVRRFAAPTALAAD